MARTFLFFAAVTAALFTACSSIDTAQNLSGGTNSANSVSNNVANNSVGSTAPSATPDMLARGRQFYQATCANCHKENGTGGPVTIEGKKLKPENLVSDKIKNWPDDRYFKIISEGVEDEGMPAFGDRLSDDEIRAVIGYIRAGLQQKEEITLSNAAR